MPLGNVGGWRCRAALSETAGNGIAGSRFPRARRETKNDRPMIDCAQEIKMRRPPSALIAASWLLALSSAWAADAATFTKDQADHGHVQYNTRCAQCHRPDLTGALGPALTGKTFSDHWGGKNVGDFYDYEHANMPANNPGTVDEDTLLAITAYILSRNGVAAGATALTTDSAKALTLPTGK